MKCFTIVHIFQCSLLYFMLLLYSHTQASVIQHSNHWPQSLADGHCIMVVHAAWWSSMDGQKRHLHCFWWCSSAEVVMFLDKSRHYMPQVSRGPINLLEKNRRFTTVYSGWFFLRGGLPCGRTRFIVYIWSSYSLCASLWLLHVGWTAFSICSQLNSKSLYRVVAWTH